ncbi:MAG: hypothetical protein MUP22_13395 [Desulfobacterales bacterium]|nr:hypothetical protein [Desulfobacterales bacterium]
METAYSHILRPLSIGATSFKNRVVGLPVYTGYAYQSGQVSDMMIDHYTDIARSGASMIVVANAAVSENGILSRYNLRVDSDEFIPGLHKLATAIKSAGAIACLQLNHAGKFAKSSNPIMPSTLDASHVAFNINSLKHFMEFFPLEKRFRLTQNFLKMASNWSQGMTEEEKVFLKQAYVKAVLRALEAGFQGIELHGASGYLLCQFLSGFTNKEIDGSPKSFSDRIWFPLQLVQEVKQHLPDTALFGYRIILEEWVPGGIDQKESLLWAKALQKENISYLSTSAGTYNSMFAPHVRHRMQKIAYMEKSIKKLNESVNVPVIAAGRITHPEIADRLIKNHVADLIGLGRPLRADKNWIKKSRSISEPIKICVNCNSCLKRVVLDRGFNCRRWTSFEQEKVDLDHKLLSVNFGSLWVISDKTDTTIYKNMLTNFLPSTDTIKSVLQPTVMFLTIKDGHRLRDKEIHDFVMWSNQTMRGIGFQHPTIQKMVRDLDSSPDKAIASEVSKKEYGIVLICRNEQESWRNRLPYRVRGKVVGMLGPAPNQNNVLVPIDMSGTTALILSFIRQNYGNSHALTFHFIHVLEDKGLQIEKRWEQLSKLAGYDISLPLELIPKSNDIAQTILEKIQSKQFGSVIMGKRSISMVKRWLLGTTSAAVLHKLKDESIFIIE